MNILVAIGKGQVQDTFFTQKVRDELEKIGNVIYNPFDRQAFTKEELMEYIVDVDVLITGWGSPRVDADVLKCANKLKVHAHAAGAVASYVSKEEYDRSIIVLSGNDVFAKSVAEGCLCYTLTALRRNEEFRDSMRNGGWKLEDGANRGLIGKKIGIVGYGAISRYYIELLQWFHPEILLVSNHMTEEDANQLHVKKASLDEVFSTCEIISLHTAWSKKTENMIGEDLLKKIQPGALFVNTARAQIVEKEALYRQLETGRFQAVLDVYHEEPLPVDDPLRTMKNVMIYPHTTGPSFDMREQVTLKLLKDVTLIFDGKPYEDEITYETSLRMSVG